MSGLRADAVPPRARRQPQCLPSLRASPADRRGDAPQPAVRRRPVDARRAAATAGRSAALPRPQALCRAAARGPGCLRAGQRCGGRRAWPDRRPPGRRRRLRVRLHGRLDGHRRRGGAGDRGAPGGAAGGGADRRAGLGRRPHAGGRAVADADAAHDPCRRYGQGGRPSLHRAVDRSDDGRRVRLLCDGRRHHAGRARRDHRFCRRPRHRRDDPREIAARFSARRISLRARHGRPGRAARRAARHAGARDRTAARAGGREAL